MSSPDVLPGFFEPLLKDQYAQSDVERIMRGCSATRPVTLRANTLRATSDEVSAALEGSGLEFERVSWYDDAFIIRNAREKALWDLPVYKEGKVYLQSLSSMIPALVLDPQPREDICDMCAAPGGKTSQIAALTDNRAFVTACEMHAPRAEKLLYNLQKLGAPNVTVMQVDARRLDEFFSFDRILVDAPCSGSGTLRAHDPRTFKHFTPALVHKSQKSQRALLAKALELMKPGATLVYSTCSVLACENEDIVEQALRQARKHASFEALPVVANASDPLADDIDAFGRARLSTGDARRARPLFEPDTAASLPLLPTRLEGALCLAPSDLYEGFFVAKIKRTG